MSKIPKTARTFAISLKPVWDVNEIEKFVNSLTGTAKVYAINHDKDVGVEPHTHFVLDYATPRNITTIANLFEVESNFVEVVRNKKGMLRYMIHLDDKDKHQYQSSEVISNNKIKFDDVLLGDTLTDKEIADYITKGKGIELMGVVPAGKLRTIQSFLHFDNSNNTLNELRKLNKKVDEMTDVIDEVKLIADGFMKSIDTSREDLIKGFKMIADSITSSVKKYKRIR